MPIFASVSPLITSISKPQSSFTRAKNCALLLAERTAAVANAYSLSVFSAFAQLTKSATASAVRSIASSFIEPENDRPSPKRVVRIRLYKVFPSDTSARRTELEPISIAEIFIIKLNYPYPTEKPSRLKAQDTEDDCQTANPRAFFRPPQSAAYTLLFQPSALFPALPL